jgi:hypothetical protein
MGTGALLGLGAGFAWSFAVLSCFPVFPRAASAGRLIMILLADMALAAAIALASALVLVLVVATIASVIL